MPRVRVEQFTVPSWGEFERQRPDRWTDSDHALITAALAHTATRTTESEERLFALARRWITPSGWPVTWSPYPVRGGGRVASPHPG